MKGNHHTYTRWIIQKGMGETNEASVQLFYPKEKERINMAKIVYGKYDTQEEALQAVNALKYKGADGSDITILADKADRLRFTKEAPNSDVDTEAATGESFMDKIASFFSVDSTERIEDRLMAKGIQGVEAERLAEDVDNGKILILVDEGAASMMETGLNDQTTHNSGLYANRNEEKAREEERKSQTVGNMSRADDLSVTADTRLDDSNLHEKDDLDKKRTYPKNRIDTDNL